MAVVEGGTCHIQRGSFSALNEALLQPLDHRYLRQFQQLGIGGRIAPMDEGQAVEKQQAFNGPHVSRGCCFVRPKIHGVPGEAADQQRHVIHQFRHRALT
ncbi:hypothetical protein D3C76_636140 [compost metagenome]